MRTFKSRSSPFLSFALMLLTVFPIVMTSNPALAKKHEGKCFNQIEEDFDGCDIKVKKRTIEIRFDKKSNRDANQLIPIEQITAISSGKRVKGRLKSLARDVLRSPISPLPFLGRVTLGLVPGLSKKKSEQYLIEYQDEAGNPQVTIFRVDRDDAKKMTKDLEKRTDLEVD